MKLAFPDLPFAENALEPQMSARTVDFHYHKHHRAYFDKASNLIQDTPYADMDLRQIVRKAASNPKQTELFNNAAQVWNHAKFWESLKPGGGAPNGRVEELIRRDFGNYDNFRKRFHAAAMGRFGSGWAWLVLDHGRMRILTTANAETPLTAPITTLLAFDVWEHAYYLDYQNQRARFIDAFLDSMVNWDHANACIAAESSEVHPPERVGARRVG